MMMDTGFTRGFLAGFGCIFLLGVWTPMTAFVAPPPAGQVQREDMVSQASQAHVPLSDGLAWQQTASLAPTAVTALAALALYTMAKKRSNSASTLVHGRQVVPVVPVIQSHGGSIARKALDQSSRYADLELDEAELIKNGKHVLVAYIMKPKAGYDYLATAAHFAAESSTGTNVNVCTTDDFTKSVDALVYYIDPEEEEMKIAYPTMLFDRNITDGRAMMCSILTLTIGNNQGMGDVEYGKIYDIYFPPAYLRLFDGPSCSVVDMWRILGRGTKDGGLVVGTIIKPKLGLQPKPFGEACYAFWMGGDFIKNDEPQGNQIFCQMNECIPEVVKAMRACIKETGESKLFSANITADDPAEMIARGKYVLSQFGPLGENTAFLVDGYVSGGTAITVARRNFPKQFLHYHRAGHGAVTSPQTQRGYTAFVHTKISRIIGASGIHVGTMSFGKMEGDASDKCIAYMLQDDEADGPYYRQEWEGMIQTTPIISGGMNALRLPAFFENLGHSNVILTAGGGSFGHKDGPKQGAMSCRQGEEAWKLWKAGTYGDVSLSDGVVEYAKTHEEIKGAFLTFQKDADQIYPGWKEKLGYTGESSVQAATFDWQKKAAAAAFTGANLSSSRETARQALDQSSRYADLELDEAELIKNGKHVLVAYIMKPKAGYDYLATAAHFAAESSTGTNVNVCTTDDFTKSVDALVYYIDPEEEEMKIAYPTMLFDRNITDGRAMMCSILTLTIGNNQGMGDVEYGKIYDIYFPPAYLRLFDGPSCSVVDMWRILGRGTKDGGLVVGTIIKPKLGLQPKPFGEACYAFWMGGDFIKNDEPQGNQIFCQMNECIPEVVKAMRACIKETGESKLFSANITADDPAEMIARGKYVLSQFGPLGENTAFLVDGYVSGGTAITVARRNFPKQFLHYHRAGHGAVTSPQTQRGYTAFVHTKISRIIGASGIHVGTMSFGKMEGDASDKCIAYMLQDDEADGPYYRQEWEGMIQTTPIISGGMNALRLPAFFENLGHSNVILTAGGGSFGHKDGPKQGAMSCRQGEEAWKLWKAGTYGDVSLSDGVVEYAKTHEEIKGAFLTFQKDADQIYPGWKEKLGYTGESSVQAATFDWQKKAAAAAFTGASSCSRDVVALGALDQSSRYADLELDEAELIKNGKHVLVAYIMKPKAGYDYLATAAHFAAESSTGTNVNVCTTDDFTKSVDALVYYIDPEEEEMKIAYPTMLFDRNITDGRAMMCSILTLTIGNNQGMGDVEYGKIYDIYFPPAYLRLFDGPSCSVVDMWRILGRGTKDGGLVVGTIIKPKLGLQPKPFGEACYAFWMGGDFIKNDEPQGNQIFCQMNECIPEVVKAMRACIKETGESKLFSANITADDPAEMIARGKYVLSQFGPLGENTAFLVDGYVSGGTAITVARRNFPKQFLHYHRAGHGAVTSPQTQRGYTAFVHTKISRIIGASGIHVGTMSFGKMEGDASDKCIAYMLQDDEADGPYYRQEWEGMIQTTPIISGGMNALRLPAFFENLGHSNVILTAGGGSFGHKDGPKQGAMSCRQGEEAWKLWKAGTYGDVSLSDGVVEYAKTHEEIKGAFLTFQKDADQIYPGWKEKLGYTGESSVQAATFDWQKKAAAASFTGLSSSSSASVPCAALDQSSRYADLELDEAELIKNGKHVLVAYIMKPKAGYDYLATAAHFAAESSTGTNVNVCTTDDFTKSVDALVYYIDPEEEEMKIAYPTMLFDRNITDGRAMMCSILTLTIGNNQGMGDVEYGKIYDIYFPPAYLRLFDGPSCSVVDMWRILGRGTKDGGLVVGTIIKPKLGLQPKPFGEACYAFWMGGDFIKNDEPQGNQIFCQMNECIPEVVKAMRACIKETGESKLFSANITADDPAEMIARGKYVLSQFGPLGENTAFLVDGYVSGGTAITVARRNFPKQFLHYHRAGHGAVTSPQTQRGYTAFVHTKISRIIGASGIHVGTMSFGKMEGDASDKCIAYMLQDDEADGPYYRQEWEGMIQTTPIISGGMNALRLPAFFENLGHSNVILTAGGGSFGHKDGPKQGAMSCRQGEEAWKLWKAGTYGDVSLSDGVVEYAKTHEEIKGAFLTFQKDADQIYPGWKEKLGYTGESSVQAATFDWQKKAAAAAFTGASISASSKMSCGALDQSSRYADLELDEAELIKNGKHVLVAYIMKPKAGYDYLATAAHFAAESSTGTNVNVCTTDDFTKSVDALVYYIDPEEEEMKIAYPTMLFDRNITDGRAMMCSILTLTIGNNQGMGDVEYGKIYDIYFPPAYLRLFDGPSCSVVDMWRILGRGTKDGGLVVGTIIKPKLGLQPKPFGEACYAFWMGGDFIKNDEPQGNQIFCQMNECIPEVVKAMRACIKETGESKLFSANITADDPAEMIARGKYVLSQFGPLGENTAFLVDGYVSGGTAITVARRNFPKQFLHYHRAGHGAVTSPQTQRGYTAFVHTKISRIIGASGIHVGTMSFGKMEGDASDKCIAYMLQDDEADGPYYRQEWEGMIQTTPIISGGMNALRLPAFFENLGHSNVILTAGGGSFGHKDGPKQGAMSCRQGEEAWKLWKAGTYGDVSLSDGVVEYAKTHEEIKGAFLTFQKDADQIYPGWKEKLGYTGESSVQAATFDWQKKAAA